MRENSTESIRVDVIELLEIPYLPMKAGERAAAYCWNDGQYNVFHSEFYGNSWIEGATDFVSTAHTYIY